MTPRFYYVYACAGPDKKKRQREDFNTAQLKRLVEVYDMEESQRPDREQLAKELDQIEGNVCLDPQTSTLGVIEFFGELLCV